MLLNILQCIAQPPPRRRIWPTMSVLSQLKNPAALKAWNKRPGAQAQNNSAAAQNEESQGGKGAESTTGERSRCQPLGGWRSQPRGFELRA